MRSKSIDNVCQKLTEREEFGRIKYGQDVDQAKLTELEWLNHAQQEAMDLANYLEKLIQIAAEKEREKTEPRLFSE